MASGGEFSDTSDEVFDRNCNVCQDENTVSEAICFCMVCTKYYCTPCLDCHNKIHREHRDKLLDGAAMLASQSKRPERVALTSMCVEHVDRLVEMYCYDDNSVCCTMCLAIYHKKCTKVGYIPTIANGFSTDPDVAKTKSDLHKVMKELVTIKSSRQNDQTRIKKEKQYILVQVEDSRRRINAVFDQLEDAVVREADTRYNSFDVHIQTDLDVCEKAITTIEKAIAELEDTDKQPEAQLFIRVKTGEQNMEEWQSIVDQIQDNVGNEKIEFVIDGHIQDYLDELKILGKFVEERRESSQCQMVIRGNAIDELVTNVDTMEGAIKTQTANSEEDIRGKLLTIVDILKVDNQPRRANSEEDIRGKLRTNEDTLKRAGQSLKTSSEKDVRRTNVETLNGAYQLRRVNSEKDVRKKQGTDESMLKGDRQPRIMIVEENVRSKLMTNMDTLKGIRQPILVISEKDVRQKTASKSRTVVKRDDGVVKMEEDIYTCTIVGSCYLPDGGALLTDSNNSKLKRINFSNKITDICNVPDPRAVCYIQPSHEAAVSVRGAIHIISLGKEMKVTRTIKIGKFFLGYGLAYCNGRLYVSAAWGKKLNHYEYTTGKLLRTVDTDTHGKNIFSRTQHVATNTDGTQIWVADYDKGLIQLDNNMNLVRVVKTEEMGGTRGVCVDNEDNVYICCEEPRQVLQLIANGEKVNTLLRPDELPGDPVSVSYDNARSRLLVTMFNTDTIQVIYFK